MENFSIELKNKLKSIGATENEIKVALHGNTREQQLNSLSVYIAAKAPDTDTINTLRSFTAKGNDEEILSCLDKASKALKKHVFNN
jgi:molybdopterin-biosynthesis enzyme MoeA-like protein